MVSEVNQRFLNSYVLLEEIGRGGFGVVRKAHHTIFNRACAIKFFRAWDEYDKNFFLNEAKMHVQLQHPYILPIIDAGIDDNGSPYLITLYAPGGSLRDLIERRTLNPLKFEDALAILFQIGEALHYTHQQEIVHRDLKPENILFDEKGNALLADFGIAMQLKDLITTHPEFVAGTRAYMAPEVFDGEFSTKSDQYALACIAFELLTGQKPFNLPPNASSDLWIAWKQVHNETVPTSLGELRPELPAYIQRAVHIALSKKHIDRYVDVAAFMAALKNIDGQSTILDPHMPERNGQIASVGVSPEEEVTPLVKKAIEELGHPKYAVRKQAVEKLAQSSRRSPAAHEVLLKGLDDPLLPDVRVYCALALSNDPRAVLGLAEALRFRPPTLKEKIKVVGGLPPDPTIRIKAEAALLKLRETAIPILLGALKDQDKQIRINAATALALFRDKATTPGLLTALIEDSKVEVRREAAKALKGIGDRTAVISLFRALHDVDGEVRITVIETLGNTGDVKVIPNLLEVLSDLDEEVRNAVSDVLIKFGKKAVSGLLEVLHSKPFAKARAAKVLGIIGDPTAVPELLTALDNQGDKVLRREAAVALGRIGGDEAISGLLGALHDQESFVRQAAATALGRIKNPTTIPNLSAALLENPYSYDVQRAIIGALENFENPRAAIPDLQRALHKGDLVKDVKSRAARLLRQLDALPLLYRWLYRE
ncbi:MAG TPA: HEAT repeat domain-containing protein [Ktedonobacteraceae bacterium]|nr:HEAT repeat domain-containing protein [Ktedonobacteraceae bacterium]